MLNLVKLEPRIMLDAVGFAVDPGDFGFDDHDAADHDYDPDEISGFSNEPLTLADLEAGEDNPGGAGEIVFIVGDVDDREFLANGVQNAETAVIGAGENGVESITDFLQNRSDISAVHIVSHGAPGSVNIGWSVSINGDYAAVGAWKDDDNGSASGSAYIY